jgi:hypothetical protein
MSSNSSNRTIIAIKNNPFNSIAVCARENELITNSIKTKSLLLLKLYMYYIYFWLQKNEFQGSWITYIISNNYF